MKYVIEVEELKDKAVSEMEDMCAYLTVGDRRLAEIHRARAEVYEDMLSEMNIELPLENEHYSTMMEIAEENGLW